MSCTLGRGDLDLDLKGRLQPEQVASLLQGCQRLALHLRVQVTQFRFFSLSSGTDLTCHMNAYAGKGAEIWMLWGQFHCIAFIALQVLHNAKMMRFNTKALINTSTALLYGLAS